MRIRLFLNYPTFGTYGTSYRVLDMTTVSMLHQLIWKLMYARVNLTMIFCTTGQIFE